MQIPLKLTVLGIALPALVLPVLAREILPPTTNLTYWLIDILLKVVVPTICLLWLYRIGVGPDRYGLQSPRARYSWSEFISISFICTAVFLSSVIVDNIVDNYLPAPEQNTKYGVDSFGRGGGAAAIAYHSLSAGIFEEIYFRGVLGLVLLKNRQMPSIVTYIVGSSLAFVGIHRIESAADLITLLFFGGSAAAMYLLLRNLWPIIVAHTLYDLVIFVWRSKLSMPI